MVGGSTVILSAGTYLCGTGIGDGVVIYPGTTNCMNQTTCAMAVTALCGPTGNCSGTPGCL